MSEITKEERDNILKLSEISLLLDNYEDIFSDFDPRPFSERAVSQDFLAEIQRATTEKPSGNIELTFMIPKLNRNFVHEALVKKRLKEHFRKHFIQLDEKTKKHKRKDYLITFSGIAMLFAATYLDSLEISFWWGHLLRVLLEPGGWFLGWTGLDHLLFTTHKEEVEREFYKKMAGSHIIFKPY